MTNLDGILRRRDTTLPTKVRLVKAMVFPVVTYGCESWIIKKPEHRRIAAFELWCWRRLLTVPWATLVVQIVKNPSAMQETCIRSLGWEDPLEKGMGDQTGQS